ncbi:MAG: hypothetical protein KAY37_11905 [Phycisphaerae bacterium]|nr:hypothetical protein [Phycisphaerae bacterium]
MTRSATNTTCLTMSALAALGLALSGPEKAVADLGDGLVGYWNFNHGQALDYSGNENHGTVHGATWAYGVSGYALGFDGIDDYVELNERVTLSRYAAALCWWMKPADTADSVVFSWAPADTLTSMIESHTNSIYAETSRNCNYFNFYGVEKPTTWSFYAILFQDEHAYLYIDGQYYGEADQYGTDGCGGDPVDHLVADFWLQYIGVSTGYSPHFAGAIDEIRVYDRVLAPEEINALYNYGRLSYWWRFDEGTGSIAHDNSGNENHGTVYGAEWTSGVSGYALQFDGVDDFIELSHFTTVDRHDGTICWWMKPTDTSNAAVFSWRPADTLTSMIESHTTHVYAETYRNCNYFLFYDVDKTTEWSFYAIVFNNERAYLFIDGTFLKEADSYGTDGCYGEPVDKLVGDFWLKYIGVSTGYSPNFAGIMDEVRVFNRSLTQDEIADLYWNVFPDPQEDTTDGDQAEISGTSNDPVNTATGNFAHQETDLSIPSRGSPITFTRFYNSKAAAPGRRTGAFCGRQTLSNLALAREDTSGSISGFETIAFDGKASIQGGQQMILSGKRRGSFAASALAAAVLAFAGADGALADPGGGGGLDRGASDYPMGPGWTHAYYIWFEPDAPDAQVAVHWGDGHADYWMDDGEGGYVMSVPGVYDRIVDNGDDTWTLTRTNEDVYDFDTNGRLTSITDKNANVTTLAYNDANVPLYVTHVTDPVGRTLVLAYVDVGGGEWRLQSITDWTGRDVQYGYTDGLLTQVTDVMEETVVYTHDENGYLNSITDQRDVQVVHNTYDADGRVLEQLDGNDNPTTFVYPDGRGENETTMTFQITVPGEGEPHALEVKHPHEDRYKRQLAVKDALGEIVEFGYDGMFNRNKITDRNGNLTQFEYDEHGNVLSATEADDPEDPDDGGTTAVAYDDPDFVRLPTQMTDALGYPTEWTYDDYGNVATEKRYLDLEQTEYVEKGWTYNDLGQRLTETDERGNVHQWIYDPVTTLLTEEIDRAGNHAWYGYDDLWRRIWATDGRGTGPEDPYYTTYYFYDDADRLVRIEGPPLPDAPDGITQWFGYDEVGNRKWVTNGQGSAAEDPNHTTYFFYDNNRNMIRSEAPLDGNPQYSVTRHAYDELNRKVKIFDANNSDPENGSETYILNDAGRLVEKHDAEGNIWTSTYDAQGNLLSQSQPSDSDPNGITVFHEYDAMNRRVLTYEELGNQTHFEYDVLGRLARQTDAEGNETDFGYDALGRLVCVVDAEDGWTEYTYDATGNLIEIEDANDGVVSTRECDALNRLILAKDGNHNIYEYAYDEVGNQIWVKDAKGAETVLIYDAANRLMNIYYPDATQASYSYDNNGNRTAMTDSSGSSSFTYDDLNRLRSTTDSFGKVVQYDYDPVGNRTTLTYPDNKQVTYGYDTVNRLTTITDWAVPARVTQYDYDGMRIETVTYPNGVVETRGYDAAGRLTSTDTEDSSTNGLLSFAWVRDGVGNPTSATETGTLQPTLEQLQVEYEYDADNRLVESSQGTYQYDANGNLTSQTVGGTTATFAYDAEDRLVSQTTDANTVQHVYDGDSYRIARIDGAGETRYVLDRGRSMSHVLCETDETGTIIAYYLQGPALIARIGADGSQRYYHTNDIGNVVALTDENELITDRYGYTPFGLPKAQEGSTDNPFTYVGALGVMAEADGLYFMRARFYDPDTGRFLGKDPVEGALTDPRSLHRYVYGLNSPAVITDASGEIAPLIIAIIWASPTIVTGVQDLVDIYVNKTRKQPRSWQQYVGTLIAGISCLLPETFGEGIAQRITEMLGAEYVESNMLTDLFTGEPSEPLDPDTLLDIQGEIAQQQWDRSGGSSVTHITAYPDNVPALGNLVGAEERSDDVAGCPSTPR